MFSASQASHGSFHTAIGQLTAAHVCENPVQVENSPPHHSQQQTQVKNNNTKCWWVQSAISVPVKMTVIAAGVERQVPEWRSGPLPEVGVSLCRQSVGVFPVDSRETARDDRPHVKVQTRTTTGFGIMNNRPSALRESASKSTVIVP